MRAWVREDPDIVTWGMTRIEVAGAIERLARQGGLDPSLRRQALAELERLAVAWHEVTDLLAVRARALPILSRHALRSADAAQLGAALTVADPDPASLIVVCLDRRLAEAAEREGFPVRSWPG